MRAYKTPILLSEEQKIIGGVLTLRQLAYVLGGAMLTYDLASRLYKLAGLGAAFTFAFILYSFFFLLAFCKVQKYGLNFDTYIVLKITFMMKQKKISVRQRNLTGEMIKSTTSDRSRRHEASS